MTPATGAGDQVLVAPRPARGILTHRDQVFHIGELVPVRGDLAAEARVEDQ